MLGYVSGERKLGSRRGLYLAGKGKMEFYGFCIQSQPAGYRSPTRSKEVRPFVLQFGVIWCTSISWGPALTL